MSKEFEEIVLKKLDKVDATEKLIQDLAKKLDKVDKSTQEGFKNLNDKFAVFDYEINRKIDTLFDAFAVNREKDLVHEKDINSLDEKVFNHDIRISNLEDKILTA